MDSNVTIQTRIEQELRNLGYENPMAIYKNDSDAVHVFLSVFGRSVSLMLRVSVPRRKRSIPEVTMLPNPYAGKINREVKSAVHAALEYYRDSCL